MQTILVQTAVCSNGSSTYYVSWYQDCEMNYRLTLRPGQQFPVVIGLVLRLSATSTVAYQHQASLTTDSAVRVYSCCMGGPRMHPCHEAVQTPEIRRQGGEGSQCSAEGQARLVHGRLLYTRFNSPWKRSDLHQGCIEITGIYLTRVGCISLLVLHLRTKKCVLYTGSYGTS